METLHTKKKCERNEYSEDPSTTTTTTNTSPPLLQLTKELDGVSLKGVNMTGRGADGAMDGRAVSQKTRAKQICDLELGERAATQEGLMRSRRL